MRKSREQISYNWYLNHGGIGYPMLAALESTAIVLIPAFRRGLFCVDLALVNKLQL
jgi:hypothetical protein